METMCLMPFHLLSRPPLSSLLWCAHACTCVWPAVDGYWLHNGTKATCSCVIRARASDSETARGCVGTTLSPWNFIPTPQSLLWFATTDKKDRVIQMCIALRFLFTPECTFSPLQKISHNPLTWSNKWYTHIVLLCCYQHFIPSWLNGQTW